MAGPAVAIGARARLCRAAALAALAVPALALATTDGPPPSAPSETLQALVGREATALQLCAVAYATLKEGQPEALGGASGCAEFAPATPDTVFQAASLSKPVFAYGVLLLVREGVLDLDRPLADYLPEGYLHVQNLLPFDGPPRTDHVPASVLQRLTTRQVLNHSSGLPNWTRGPLQPEFEPGSRWQYSGEAYLLLQKVVETVTGQGLEAWMQQRVFQPLGMQHSSFIWQPDWTPLRAAGQPRHVDFPRAFAAMSLYTSARDYARFLAALWADAPARAWIQQQPVPVDARRGLAWGLGWGLEPTAEGHALWQWGNNPGYRAFAMLSPEGRAVVVLSNGEQGLRLADPLVRAVMPGAHPLFKSWLLREGLGHWLCQRLDWCP